MFVTDLIIEGKPEREIVVNPNWEQIRNYILTLDGYSYSLVMFGRSKIDENGNVADTEEYMSIAGGGRKNRLYTCDIYSYETGQKFMFDPTKTDNKPVEITDIFYPTKVEENQCFYLDDILVAAETYARFGRADETYSWKTY